MMRRARWIRLGFGDLCELRSVAAALSGVQTRSAAPIVLWGSDRGWAEPRFAFAVVAPEHLAPGTRARWTAWALSPAVAAYRDFGVRAYLEGSGIATQGRRIAASRAEVIHGCVVISAEIGAAACERSPLFASTERAIEFRAWLRGGLGLAATQWVGADGAPPERAFEAVMRARFEAQHDWQFENSWPSGSERLALQAARAVADPLVAAPESAPTIATL